MLGRKNLSKGVKVEVGEEQAAVDLFVVVEYGVRIPDIAWQIQENVKRAIETMTGLEVVEVNVHIQGRPLPQRRTGRRSPGEIVAGDRREGAGGNQLAPSTGRSCSSSFCFWRSCSRASCQRPRLARAGERGVLLEVRRKGAET